ncbi:MAG TPA: hypothetical protein DCP28_10005 [Cytophagales bacterium]|nr:hypothetical protein [Cytophagales bacterium]
MKLSHSLYLLLGAVACCFVSCDSPKGVGYSWEQLDSLYYEVPVYDSTALAMFTDQVRQLAQERLQAYNQAADAPDSVGSFLDSLNTIADFYREYLRVALVAGDDALTQSLYADLHAFIRDDMTSNAGGYDGIAYVSFAQALRDTVEQKAPLREAFSQRLRAQIEQAEYTPRYYLFYFSDQGSSSYVSSWQGELARLDTVDSLSGFQADALISAFINHEIFAGMEDTYSEVVEQYREDHYVVYDSLKIPMADGTLLDGNVVVPKGLGPVPTILMANPYVRSMDVSGYNFYGADHGFATITVHPRGVRLSEGTFSPFEREAEDIPQIIDWIIAQPWSDGQVAMSGGSYLGFSQWAALKNPHPALKTIVPSVSVGIGIDYPYHNRVMMNYALRWINYVTNTNMSDGANFGNTPYWDSLYHVWYTSGRSSRALDTLDQAPDSIWQRWLDHPGFDRYWQDMRASTPEEFAAIDIPILTTTGYYDADQMGALHYYSMHQRYGRPEVVENHPLLIGPYDHGGGQTRQRNSSIMDYPLPPEAVADITTMVYEWCGYVMRGEPKPELLKNRVNHYIMEQGWQHLPSVAAISDSLTLYPTGSGKDSLSLLQPEPGNATVQLTEDFTLDSLDDFGNYPLIKAAELLEDFWSEGLVWDTPPLEKDAVLAGRPQVNLTLTPNVQDVDLMFYFLEVLPDGEMVYLSEMLQRASYVKDREQRQLLTPGQPATLQMPNSSWISRRLSAGNRLRVVVLVNSTPSWQKNYGSGKPVADETSADFVPIQLQIDLGKSKVSFPLAPEMD